MTRIFHSAADRMNSPAPGERAKEPDFFSRQITEARRFYLQLRGPWKEPLVIVGGGNEHCNADYHVKRATFPYYSVEFVASGTGILHIRNQRHSLVTGAVFAYGSNVPHEIRSSSDKPMEKYFLTFAGREAPRWLATACPSPDVVVQSSAPQHIVQLFEGIIDAGRHETPYRPRIYRAIAEHIFLRIAETAVPLGTVGTEAFDTFQRSRELIEARYLRLRSLSEIAELCEVDPAYICRLFKRFAHQSPWQYVLRLKMRDAAQRLQSQHVRVSEVAYALGFDDPFQFSRTFRRVFGTSPRQFVQLQRRQSSPGNVAE